MIYEADDLSTNALRALRDNVEHRLTGSYLICSDKEVIQELADGGLIETTEESHEEARLTGQGMDILETI